MIAHQLLIDPGTGETVDLELDLEALTLAAGPLGAERAVQTFASQTELAAAYRAYAAAHYARDFIDNDTSSQRVLDFARLAERERLAARLEPLTDDLESPEWEGLLDVLEAVVLAVRHRAASPAIAAVRVGRGEFEFANVALDDHVVLASELGEENAAFFSWEVLVHELYAEACGEAGEAGEGVQLWHADTVGARVAARLEASALFPDDVAARLAPGYTIHVCGMDDARNSDAERARARASLVLPLSTYVAGEWTAAAIR